MQPRKHKSINPIHLSFPDIIEKIQRLDLNLGLSIQKVLMFEVIRPFWITALTVVDLFSATP